MSRNQRDRDNEPSSSFFGTLLKGIGIGLAVGAVGMLAGYAVGFSKFV